MQTAIIYVSNHGTTEKIAKYISENIGKDKTTLINIKKYSNINLDNFTHIIIGGSVHAGQVQTRLKKFVNTYKSVLLTKKTALFLCGMNEPEYNKQLENAFPESLRLSARTVKMVGGEFLLEEMNFIEKAIVKRIAKVKESVSKINYEEIDNLIYELYS